MTRGAGGLEQFESRLHPAVVADIRGWHDLPALAGLHASLQAHTQPKSFFDSFAEAMVARHLRRRNCVLRFEVETPTGRCCDFEVSDGPRRFYLHVKRLDSERPVRRQLTISSRLRVLERIERPYIVGVRWQEDLDDEQMQRFVTVASEFVTRARVGDEHLVLDDEGQELGGVRIVAPWDGPTVSLVIGLPSGFIDETARVSKLLRKAYEQFMPRALNVILICTPHEEDVVDFESALLGEHIERWDRFPPRGRRIAHGRAADGFWEGSGRGDASVAGWFHFKPSEEDMRARLWFRETAVIDSEIRSWLESLFNGTNATR